VEIGRVAFERGLERLPLFDRRVLGGEFADARKNEIDLRRQRLLYPKRAVIVEGSDAVGDGHEIRAAPSGHARYEINDSALCRAVVPGRERIGPAGLYPVRWARSGRARSEGRCTPISAY